MTAQEWETGSWASTRPSSPRDLKHPKPLWLVNTMFFSHVTSHDFTTGQTFLKTFFLSQKKLGKKTDLKPKPREMYKFDSQLEGGIRRTYLSYLFMISSGADSTVTICWFVFFCVTFMFRQPCATDHVSLAGQCYKRIQNILSTSGSGSFPAKMEAKTGSEEHAVTLLAIPYIFGVPFTWTVHAVELEEFPGVSQIMKSLGFPQIGMERPHLTSFPDWFTPRRWEFSGVRRGGFHVIKEMVFHDVFHGFFKTFFIWFLSNDLRVQQLFFTALYSQ